MSEMLLSLRIALKNDLTAPMKRALGEVSKDARVLSLALKGVDSEAQSASRSIAGIGAGDPLKGINSQLTTTRGLLREIAAGAARAAGSFGRMPAGQALRPAMGAARGANAAFQGFQAGNLALQYQMTKPIDYELALAHLANTAFTDRNTLGRQQGAGELNAAIMGAVRTGKGTREQALSALDTMIASGALSIDESKKLLPTILKGATATGADPNQLAGIAIRAKQSFGISPGQIPQALDMAIAAGQAGGFELKDMARWLPEQMAAGRMSGMKGLGDFGRLLALNQLSVMTAGSKDAAGNNLVNLLAKLNSQDTANDAKKLGIDLSGTLANARGQGIDPVTAFVALINREAGKDKQYVSLRDKASRAGSADEKTATYESMADILQGKAVGKLIQDRQALMALIAIMNGGEQLNGILGKTMNGAGSMAANFDLVGGTYAVKRQGLEAEQEAAKTNLFGSLAGPMGTLAERTTELYQKYPLLGEAMEGLKIGANAATAALGAAGLAGLLTGGGLAAAGAGVGGAGAAAGGAGLLGAAGLYGGVLGAAGVGAAGVGGGLLGYGVYKYGLEGNAGGDKIGEMVARAVAAAGGQDARRAVEINNKVVLDGRVIAESVNRFNTMNNRRN